MQNSPPAPPPPHHSITDRARLDPGEMLAAEKVNAAAELQTEGPERAKPQIKDRGGSRGPEGWRSWWRTCGGTSPVPATCMSVQRRSGGREEA